MFYLFEFKQKTCYEDPRNEKQAGGPKLLTSKGFRSSFGRPLGRKPVLEGQPIHQTLRLELAETIHSLHSLSFFLVICLQQN